MNKILTSISPSFCRMIIDGTKTAEIRKFRPKCKVPFELYIYCTKNDSSKFIRRKIFEDYSGRGKVIGKCIIDKIYSSPTDKFFTRKTMIPISDLSRMGCVSEEELYKYARTCKSDYIWYSSLYGWHIQENSLQLYESPMSLDAFSSYLHLPKTIKNPPQSYQFL